MKSRVYSLLGAVAFSLALFGAPDAALAQAQSRCPAGGLRVADQPMRYAGTAQGVAPPAEVKRQTAVAEINTGGAVSPDYVNLPRIMAVFVDQGVAHTTIAAIVDGHIPNPGDTVLLASRYRDPRLPCHFIPWTVVTSGTIS